MYKRKDGLWVEKVPKFVDGIKQKEPKYLYAKSRQELIGKIKAYDSALENGPLLSELADMWERWRVPQVRYKTAEAYRAPVKDICHYFAGEYASAVKPQQVNQFVNMLAAQQYARRTVQQRLDVLSMVYDYGIIQLGLPMYNPTNGVSIPRGLSQTSRELPSLNDIRAINAHASDSRIALLPFLISKTGLRTGEALALRDTSFADEYIDVVDQVIFQPNKPVIGPTKTKLGVRRVPLLDDLASIIPDFKGYLFSDDGKTPFTKTQLYKRWYKYCDDSGVTCDRHMLRHYYATFLYNAKIDVKLAASIMGHDVVTMQRIYTHISEQNVAIARDQLNDFNRSGVDLGVQILKSIDIQSSYHTF